jgi:hypothetical protein
VGTFGGDAQEGARGRATGRALGAWTRERGRQRDRERERGTPTREERRGSVRRRGGIRRDQPGRDAAASFLPCRYRASTWKVLPRLNFFSPSRRTTQR